MGHDEIIKLVAQVNGALFLLSWPFVLYEVFTKNPSIITFKERLDLKRGQIIGLVVLDMADRLRSQLPRRTGRIIVEPGDEVDESPQLSDAAIEEMQNCLESHEEHLVAAVALKRITLTVLQLDKWMYWLIFSIALESVGSLICWFAMNGMSDRLAVALLAIPLLTGLAALLCAGRRQGLMYKAQMHVVSGEKR